jgi:DNA-binding CsgD family transcriptional regulator
VVARCRESWLPPDLRSRAATLREDVERFLLAAQQLSRSSLRARALLTLCRAELEDAGGPEREVSWAAAAEAWRLAGQPYDRACALVRHAEALAALRRRKDVAERLDEAEEVLAGLGAGPPLAAARRLRRAAGLPEAPADPGGAEPPEVDALTTLGVTDRERQVLTLLAQGRTNRQIGRALGMSERTAGTHVSSLLRKLGVSSRTEAAAFAGRVG